MICIHAICTPVAQFPEIFHGLQLQLFCFFTELFRAWAVPVFIMISGALFLSPQKEVDFKTFAFKYCRRLFLALLVFGGIFALMELVFPERSFRPSFVPLAVLNALTNKTWAHLWYLYLMIGLYLVTPILRAFVKVSDKKQIALTVLVLYIFCRVLPFLNSIFDLNRGFYVPFEYSVCLYLLGYALHAECIKIPPKLAAAMVVLSAAYIFAMSCFPANFPQNEAGVLHVGYLFVFCSGIFSLAKHFVSGSPTKIERLLSGASFGIYIFHAVFVNFAYKVLRLNPEKLNGLLMVLFVVAVTFAGSLVCTLVAKKIPFFKTLV